MLLSGHGTLLKSISRAIRSLRSASPSGTIRSSPQNTCTCCQGILSPKIVARHSYIGPGVDPPANATEHTPLARTAEFMTSAAASAAARPSNGNEPKTRNAAKLLLLRMPAELKAHRRQQAIRERGLS